MNTAAIAPDASSTTNTIESIRRAAAPARAASANWLIPSTSNEATSGTIVTCSARSHKAPSGSTKARTGVAAPVRATSTPASSPVIRPARVHPAGMRTLTNCRAAPGCACSRRSFIAADDSGIAPPC